MKKFVNILQTFGKSLFAPVLILPIIGLFIAFGNVFGNGNLAQYIPFLDSPYIQNFGKLLSGSAVSILTNLALVFAVGIPIGLAKKDKGYAALTGLVTFIIFINAMNLTLSMNDLLLPQEEMKAGGQGMALGVQVLEMGVFAGILVGGIVGYLHNKFSSVQFEGVMAIYSGHRFVVILAIPTAMLLGFSLSYLWPFAQTAITSSALAIKSAGSFGFLIYGFLERVLIPTGLHHLVYTPFLYTELGGTAEVCGQLYTGARNIYFAEMACSEVTSLSTTAVWDARGLTKMFGLTSAAFAMYVTADKTKKNSAKAILFPAALTSFLLGVTEPLEFSFLFTAPLLFGVHAVLTGIGMMILGLIGVNAVGANGVIDFLLYNLPLGIAKSNWPMYIAVGIFMSALYFFIFRFLILKLNLKTPGRGDEEEVKLYDKNDVKNKKTADSEAPAAAPTEDGVGLIIINALGGKANIETVDNCYTRLRVTVKDTSIIDEATLKQTGSKGVIKQGDNVQVVYGLHVKKMRDAVDEAL